MNEHPQTPHSQLQTPFHTLEGYSNTTDLYIQGHSHRGPPYSDLFTHSLSQDTLVLLTPAYTMPMHTARP